jgi:hypothetical protein
MLEFVENLHRTIRELERETQDILVSGKVRDMEQYRFLMGRLEGYRFVREGLNTLLSKNPDLQEDLR